MPTDHVSTALSRYAQFHSHWFRNSWNHFINKKPLLIGDWLIWSMEAPWKSKNNNKETTTRGMESWNDYSHFMARQFQAGHFFILASDINLVGTYRNGLLYLEFNNRHTSSNYSKINWLKNPSRFIWTYQGAEYTAQQN